MLEFFGSFDIWSLRIPTATALAVVATLGYMVGRRKWRRPDLVAPRIERESRRAQFVARELERIGEEIRGSLAAHHVSLTDFKRRLRKAGSNSQEAGRDKLCEQAEEILAPTLQLSSELATAYDQIRQQTNSLMTFTEIRTDSLTGIRNRRGLDDCLNSQFALMNRYQMVFSMVVFDVDHFKRVNDDHGHLHGDRTLKRLAWLLDEGTRETDLVARYGGEEFVVVMPQTELEQAAAFADRLRCRIEEELSVTASGGIAVAGAADRPDSLLARADAALYIAKSSGRNCLYCHNGQEITKAPQPEALACASGLNNPG